jgi:mannosyltransferase
MSIDVEELLRDGMQRFTAEVRAPAGLTRASSAPPRAGGVAQARRQPGWTLIVGPAITLAVMLWGVSARPYWGDEADTVSAVSRSVPQLIRLLGHVDAVHGLYYLLLWPVVRVAGVSEFATRLPSAVAMAAAAAGVTVIARRLVSRRAGLCAGLMFAVLPTVSLQGHDARPYAMVTAAAVLASYLLVRAAQDPRPRWFAAYGLSVALVGYIQLFGLLLMAAHAVTLIGLGRRRRAARNGQPALARRWLVTIAAAGVAVAPVAILGWAQRGEISWIPKPGWHDLDDVVNLMTAGSAASVVVIGLLSVLGGTWGDSLTMTWPPTPAPGAARSAGADRSLTWLAVPWLVLPPLLLLAVSEIKPVYNGRYLTYCLPAVALLAGTGLAALGWPMRAAAVALVVALAAPAQLGLRVPGNGMRAAAQFLGAHERPGDAIIYPEPSIPPWDLAYPEGFAHLRDISLRQTAAASGRLYASTVPLPVLERRERDVRRIWAVQMQPADNPATYLAPGFRLAHQWKLDGYLKVWLYTAGP